MKVAFDQRFLKDLQKIKTTSHKKRLRAAILKLEDAKDMTAIQNLKVLKGHPSAYRLRVGDYRVYLCQSSKLWQRWQLQTGTR